MNATAVGRNLADVASNSVAVYYLGSS